MAEVCPEVCLDPGALLFQINMYRALFELILITRHVLVFSGC